MEQADVPTPGAMTIDVVPTVRHHGAMVTDAVLKVGREIALADQTVRHRDVKTINVVRLTNATLVVAEAPADLHT